MTEREDDLKISAVVSPNLDSVSVGVFADVERVGESGDSAKLGSEFIGLNDRPSNRSVREDNNLQSLLFSGNKHLQPLGCSKEFLGRYLPTKGGGEQ